VEVSQTDDLARFAIEQAGGSVKLSYFTRVGMRAHLFPEKYAILPNVTDVPPPKKRHIYLPDNPALPPLLFKSRLPPAAVNSALAKFWTPSPLAIKYMRAAEQARQKTAAAAAAAKTAEPL